MPRTLPHTLGLLVGIAQGVGLGDDLRLQLHKLHRQLLHRHRVLQRALLAGGASQTNWPADPPPRKSGESAGSQEWGPCQLKRRPGSLAAVSSSASLAISVLWGGGGSPHAISVGWSAISIFKNLSVVILEQFGILAAGWVQEKLRQFRKKNKQNCFGAKQG